MTAPNGTTITTYMAYGTAANMPATPLVGTGVLSLYYQTDTGVLCMWNGTQWLVFTMAALGNTPSSSGWTVDNGGSVTITQAGSGPLVYVDKDITSGDTLCVVHKLVPVGSWTYTAQCKYQLPFGTNGGPSSAGLFLTNGASYVSLEVQAQGNGTNSSYPMMTVSVYHHSSSTNFSQQASIQATVPNPVWLRIIYNSVTPALTYQFSIDGVTWNTLFTESGAIMTPTGYGFGNDMHNNSLLAPITLSFNNLTIA